MSNHVFAVRSQVRVTGYGPASGLRGAVHIVDRIADDLEEPLCFSLIAPEGASIPQPVWFESQEVEGLDALVALPPSREQSGVLSAQQ